MNSGLITFDPRFSPWKRATLYLLTCTVAELIHLEEYVCFLGEKFSYIYIFLVLLYFASHRVKYTVGAHIIIVNFQSEYTHMGACTLNCFSCVQLFMTLWTCSPPGSSVHGILQARTLKWVAMPSSRRSSWPRDRTHISYLSCIGRWVL